MLSYNSMTGADAPPSPSPSQETPPNPVEQPSQPSSLSYPSMAHLERPEPSPMQAKGSLVELSGKVSKMIPLLPENPTPDDLRAYRGAMNIPERPEGYELRRASLPEGASYPEEVERSYLQFAHQNHMTPAQVQANYDWYMRNLAAMTGDAGDPGGYSEVQSMAELRQEWGADYEANVSVAKKAFWQFADDRLIEKVDATGLGNDPDFIKLFHEIGQEMLSKGRLNSVKKPRENPNVPKDVFGKVRLSYPTMEKRKG